MAAADDKTRREGLLAERAFHWREYAHQIKLGPKANQTKCRELSARMDDLDRQLYQASTREVSLADLLNSGVEFHVPGMQREVKRDGSIEVRTNSKQSSAGGAALVPTEFVAKIREYLTTRSSIFQLNTTVLPIPGNKIIDLHSMTTSGTAVLTTEAAAIAASDPAFGQVKIGAGKYSQLLSITNELLSDIEVDMTPIVARQSAHAFELGYGPTFAGNGAGTAIPSSSVPQGLFNGVAIGGTAHTGGTGVPSYTDLLGLIDSVPVQYRQADPQWLMPATAVNKIRSVVDTGGYPIWQPATTVGQPDRLLGYPVVLDANIASLGTAAGTAVMFGAFDGYYVRDAGIDIQGSSNFNFSTDITVYRCTHRIDGKWLDASGVRSMLSPTS